MNNFHSTYNARHLDPREVAQSFIWSESYNKLLGNNHSVVLGARGCGKTTIMKMLMVPALHVWRHERAEQVKQNIPFFAIYISTDIYWDVKNHTYSNQLEKFPNLSERISQFAVNSNVFNSLCDTFLDIINFEIGHTHENQEVELCNLLIESWKLPPTVPKILFIKERLAERIDFVNQLLQEIIFNKSPQENIILPDFFNLDFESSIEQIIPKFERIYGNNKQKKWALCFDELEFAPDWLQKKLFTSLRSRKQFILYKLSSSPTLTSGVVEGLSKEYSPTTGNDVELIKMWSSYDSEEFSKNIIRANLRNANDLKEIFGSNEIYNKRSSSYEEGSDFYLKTSELLKKDDSFNAFMVNKGVDISNPVPLDDKQKNSLFRKIKPIVYHRNYFIESNKKGERVNYRSRKTGADLYHGIEVLSKICDGNPRWLISIIKEMNPEAIKGTISRKKQYDSLLNAAQRFLNVMANVPIERSNLTLVDIINRIGNYFKSQLLGQEFKMDPRGTFIVDEDSVDLNADLIKLLEKGVSQGAFILIDKHDQSFDFEVRGKRFKLSYLFFLLFNLPLRNYPAINLSQCLKEIKDIGINQGTLFNPNSFVGDDI